MLITIPPACSILPWHLPKSAHPLMPSQEPSALSLAARSGPLRLSLRWAVQAFRRLAAAAERRRPLTHTFCASGTLSHGDDGNDAPARCHCAARSDPRDGYRVAQRALHSATPTHGSAPTVALGSHAVLNSSGRDSEMPPLFPRPDWKLLDRSYS